jgi:hypothetical protein
MQETRNRNTDPQTHIRSKSSSVQTGHLEILSHLKVRKGSYFLLKALAVRRHSCTSC